MMKMTATATKFKKFEPLPIEPVLTGAKRKRSGPIVYAPIVHASHLHLASDLHVHPSSVFGDKKIKMVKISPAKYTSKMTKMPLRVQLSGGGDIPFGVSTNQYGATDISIGLNSQPELDSLVAFESDLIKLAIKNKKAWWPNNPNMSDEQVKDNFTPLVVPGKEKSDGNGEKWPARMKLRIPINNTTGEPNAERTRAGQKVCKIHDYDDSIISIHDLEHREWEYAIVDLTMIYFQGKFTWGVGPKTCSKLKICFDEDAEVEYQEVQFMPKPDFSLLQKSKKQKKK